jgi:nuclear GTP-binding protein
MTKSRKTSKRTSLGDKYKAIKRGTEKHRKDRKAERSPGYRAKSKKSPGIPNSWPFKEDMLREYAENKEREEQRRLRIIDENRVKNRLKYGTLEEMVAGATADAAEYSMKDVAGGDGGDGVEAMKDKGVKKEGESNRRAYLRALQDVVKQSSVILQVSTKQRVCQCSTQTRTRPHSNQSRT